MTPKKFLRFGLAGAAVLSAAACAGPSRSYRSGLDSMLAASNYAGAMEEIEKAKAGEYSEKNAVLYYLDLGMVRHDAGEYRASDSDFDSAERQMEELFTKSVSRRAGTFLLNDNTTKYAGEVFERALMNVFRALDYVFLGASDDALVEARKVTAYLARFHDFMEGKSGYKDSAFAEYLSAMLFEQDGKNDDARICYDAAGEAYGWYASDYGTPKPQFSVPAYSDLASKGLGEIVLLHYAGVAPIKESRTFQVAWNEAMLAVSQSGEKEADSDRFKNAAMAGIAGNSITVSYPEYVQPAYSITASRIAAGPAQADSLLMEDVSAIARRALEDKNAAIRIRAIARAAIKYVLAKAASDEVEKRAGSTFGLLARMVTSATSAATEVADTRGWTTLPAQIRMARLAVPPGKQDVTVTFYGRGGEPEGGYIFKDVEVEQGRRTYLHYRTAR